jgi:ferric-dicitrate binding protein FerR (iron transport regulator)
MQNEFMNINDLIERYLTGNLSEDEYQKLTAFVKTSRKNARYFHQYKENRVPEPDEHTDKNWQKLSNRINRLSILNESFAKKTNLFISLKRIAAVLIVGLFIGGAIITYNLYKKHQSVNTLVFEAPKGEKSKVVLTDSTVIWLNSSSKIQLKNNYNVLNRKIQLEGEAYFEVTKNTRLPFKVSTGDLDVSVLGTKFNIIAYPDDNTIETSVLEGIVEITAKIKSAEKKVILRQNQKATYDKNNNTLTYQAANPVVDIAWMHNMLIFDNEHYLKVFKKLEKWYGVEIEVAGEIKYEPHYTFKIKTESLSEMLNLLNIIAPIEYKINGDKVTIYFLDNK